MDIYDYCRWCSSGSTNFMRPRPMTIECYIPQGYLISIPLKRTPCVEFVFSCIRWMRSNSLRLAFSIRSCSSRSRRASYSSSVSCGMVFPSDLSGSLRLGSDLEICTFDFLWRRSRSALRDRERVSCRLRGRGLPPT